MREQVILDNIQESYYKEEFLESEQMCEKCEEFTGDCWYEPDSVYLCGDCYTELNESSMERL